MKVHIKKIVRIGLSVLACAAAALLAASDRDEFGDFLKKATDDELEAEREKVRLDYCNPNLDKQYRIECHKKLGRFDAEINKRAWGDEEPHAPNYHKEHGWYLPDDD